VTCSLEREETDDGVDAVLAARRGAVRERPDLSALPPAIAAACGEDGVVRVLPGASNDGFTAITIACPEPATLSSPLAARVSRT
jgi:16S rRNA C967 or C1407 C5-methylase (RsmB/RsmF family)